MDYEILRFTLFTWSMSISDASMGMCHKTCSHSPTQSPTLRYKKLYVGWPNLAVGGPSLLGTA